MSFGRKGLATGQVAPAQRSFGQAAVAAAPQPQPATDADDIAARREAFVASERARAAAERQTAPVEQAEASEDGLSHLRNSARPAQRLAQAQPMDAAPRPVRQTAAWQAQPEKIPYPSAASSQATGKDKFVFGDPAGRSVGLAYVLWFVLGQLSLHRFYCGHGESAWYQIALFVCSLIVLFIFPPLGGIGFLGWIIWIFADLFMIPGMMRRFKAQHHYADTFA